MPSSANPWLVLMIVSAALLVVGIDMTVLNVVLPKLAIELDATASGKLWMVNAYSLVIAGLLPGFGVQADKIGHRTILVCGLVVFGFSSALAAFSQTPEALIGARALLAVGAAIGIWGAVWAGAAALGPMVGGLLLERFWWGSVFLINVPIVALALVMALTFIPHFPGNRSQYWDAVSSLYLTGTLVSFMYGIKCLIKAERDWIGFSASIVTGVVFTLLYINRQKHQPSPLLDMSLFRNTNFSVGAGIALLSGFALIGLQFVVSQDLQLGRDYTPLQAGLHLLPIAIASFVSGPPLGRVMLQVGVEKIIVITLFVGAVGMALYATVGHGWEPVFDVFALALVGFGVGGSMSAASTAIMINVPDERAGMAGSVESIAYELGELWV